MKKLRLAFFLVYAGTTLSLGTQAHAYWECKAREAELIGRVTSVNKTTTSKNEVRCTFQIGDITTFAENQICPLDIDEVSYYNVPDDSCQLHVGDTISGVMVVDQNDVAKLL